MNDLPIPMSRIELYLAVAAGMTGVTVPEEPMSRLEDFLAYIAGDTSVELPTPMSLTELWLNYVAGGALTDEMKLEGAYYIGGQKVDVRFFAVAGGMDGVELPQPQNRTEQYWAKIAETLPVHGVLKYATGTSITLTDVVRGITSLENVYGDTSQQTYTGKNLMPYNTYTSDDGRIMNMPNLKLGTSTFTISFDLDSFTIGTAQNVRLFIQLQDSGGNYVNNQNDPILTIVSGTSLGRYSYTFTTSGDTNNASTNIRSDSTSYNAGGRVTISNIQIEAGSTATSYEPYVGGPAPNPDYPQNVNVVTGEQTVTVTGKNQFDINTFAKGSITVVNGVATGAASQFYSQFRDGIVLANTAPVMSITATAYRDGDSSTHNGIIFRTYYTDGTYDNSLTFPNSTTTATSLTATTDPTKIVDYIGMIYGAGSNIVWHISNVQVEVGSTATTYEPYQGASYTVNFGSIELCKIGDYQDYIYKSGDDWYVHKAIGKMVLDGSEEGWKIQSGVSAYLAIEDAAGRSSSPLYSNYFTYSSSASAWGEIRFGASNQNLLFIGAITTLGSLQAWATWLESHNTDVYYILATATDTKITDSTLISQLDTLSRATLPKPVAYLTVGATSPNLPASIKISYYGEEE